MDHRLKNGEIDHEKRKYIRGGVELEMIEQEQPSCGKCMRRAESGYCNLMGRKVRTEWKCEGFKMKLADHYMENPWSEWKARRMAELATAKKKK